MHQETGSSQLFQQHHTMCNCFPLGPNPKPCQISANLCLCCLTKAACQPEQAHAIRVKRQMPNSQIRNLSEKVTQGFPKEHRNAQGSTGTPQTHASLSSLLLQTLLSVPAKSCPGRDLRLNPVTASVNSGPDSCSSGPQ